MIVLRPAETKDHGEILTLAQEAGIGMTSLPPDADVLAKKIEHSVATTQGTLENEKNEMFLFVLEDTKEKKLVGTSGVIAHVGLRRPFYSYKLSTIVQACSSLGVYSLQKVLHMVNDYTGASEIGSLFLLPDYRRDGIGSFLSRSRFLFMAEFADVFDEVVIAEMRGVQDEEGHSPFYMNLAQHFFQMDFPKADFINATQGGQFISDLMPKYPIYVNLLDPKAQAVIGRSLEASRPAIRLLEKEGFHKEGYVDVFDAGPTVQAELSNIRSARKSRKATVTAIKELSEPKRCMMSNTQYKTFRATLTQFEGDESGVTISPELAEHLLVKEGGSVRFLET